MGSSSSSEKADSIETDQTENFGLLNISSGISGGYNALEIVTFVLVALAAIVFLKVFCNRRERKEWTRCKSVYRKSSYLITPPCHPLCASRQPEFQLWRALHHHLSTQATNSATWRSTIFEGARQTLSLHFNPALHIYLPMHKSTFNQHLIQFLQRTCYEFGKRHDERTCYEIDNSLLLFATI